MADETKEPWLNYLALSTIILAVCATLATFKGGGYSTRSVLRQSQASDRWAHYQAKSIKGNLYELQRDTLTLDLKTEARGRHSEELSLALAESAKRIAKYDGEKAQIFKEAQKLESERDDASRHSQAFGMAVIFLQIAILLSSVAALMKKKPVWLAGVLVGAVGLLCFANGFFLFLG
ncbi:MAG: hypothetical protein H6Q00_2266 [Holophagaceae bacterium]|nr:hypothetical protein [Holophagaceae bacterium]